MGDPVGVLCRFVSICRLYEVLEDQEAECTTRLARARAQETRNGLGDSSGTGCWRQHVYK